MNSLGFPLLTVITFLPLVGIPILLLLKRDAAREDLMKQVTLGISVITFVISLVLLLNFVPGEAGPQFVEKTLWVPQWGIHYYLGIDGVSLWLVLLTTLLSPIAILSSWNAIHDRLREYLIFMLLLETGMVGVFVSLDLFLFYVFWEFTLVPMYFHIGIWGGPRRVYAAVKFFLYTMAGSILMLLAIISLWLTAQAQLGRGTFDLLELIKVSNGLPLQIQMWLFIAFAAAFAIKVPLWPLHSWLPDAHVEAPTAGSVILAGVLLKMGTYGFVRFNLPLFPAASVQAAPTVAILAIIGIIYGAIVSFAQTDVKKLVAYSSVSHLGFVMLGIFSLTPQGIQGGILQMINHGLSTGALFLLVGMIYERKHTRDLDAFGGLMKLMPVYGALSLIVVLSSMGLPGLNGFVGEFTILLGAFGSKALVPQPWIYTAFASTGIILAAVYMLWMFQRVYLGEVKPENQDMQDLSVREEWTLIPLVVMIFVIGLFPAPFFSVMSNSVAVMLERLPGIAAAMH
jgi:NADH-quinone oxidoreductase subunit M